MVAWRLVGSRHARSAFNGEGARLYGGRWNSPGVAVVYTSAHLSLAALELLVHVQPLTPRDVFTVFSVEWDDRLTETIPPRSLPSNWIAEPPGQATMRIGDQWFREKRSPVLAVPSVLLPEEMNYLLNPSHPKYGKLQITRVRDFFLRSAPSPLN